MKKAALISLAAVLLAAACDDNITNNYYEMETGGIAGRISPVDPGTVVSANAGEYSTTADEDGYFLLRSLTPGIYHVVVQPTNYSRREFTEIAIVPGQVEHLGEISLSTYPYPIYSTVPSDNEDSVYLGTSINLYADEALNLEDLALGTSIDPPAPGIWNEYTNKRGLVYSYYPECSTPGCRTRGRLSIGRTYQVTVGSLVKTAAGVPLGSELSFSFRTEPLSVYVDLPSPGVSGGTPVLYFQPRLSFNGSVHPDSLARAVQFDPPVEGFWIGNSHDLQQPESEHFTFFPTDLPLLSETDYLMVISDQVGLSDDVHLPQPDTTAFCTEPYGVTEVYPPYGRISSYVYFVRLDFNVDMDTASVEAAFILTDDGGHPVDGGFEWPLSTHQMRFLCNEPLDNGTYSILLTTDARTAAGENLNYKFESHFVVW